MLYMCPCSHDVIHQQLMMMVMVVMMMMMMMMMLNLNVSGIWGGKLPY